MTQKEKEIQEIEREIVRLQERLKKLKSFPENLEEQELYLMDDFPITGKHLLVSLKYKGINTVYDLVSSSPDELLNIRGIGKGKLQSIIEWMDKHGIEFNR